jgi:hypothetical protein
MPRSGSTWSYNVVRSLLKRRGRLDTTVHGWIDNEVQLDDLLGAYDDSTSDLVVKVHRLGELALEYIRKGRAKNVFTVRDPRDTVVSIHWMWKEPIEQIIASKRFQYIGALYRRLDEDGKTLFVDYPSLLLQPAATIERVAIYLGIPLTPGEAHAIQGDHEIRKVAQFSSSPAMQLFKESYDPETLLHKNHVRDGSQGYWARYLSEQQAQEILAQIGIPSSCWGLSNASG